MSLRQSARQHIRGFTLVELMIAIAVVAILASVAVPSFGRFLLRARLPAGMGALTAYQMRMEQAYQDGGHYATEGRCDASLPAAENFSFRCQGSQDGQSYLITAEGTGPLVGVTYTLDQRGSRGTPHFPWGPQNLPCWTLRGGTCDD